MRTPVCRHACRALSADALEGGLQAALFRFHLWYCWYCWPYQRQLAALGEAARAVWGAPLVPGALRALEERLLARLRRSS